MSMDFFPKCFQACPEGWLLYNEYCYLLSSDSKMTWQKAEESCQSQQAHLVSILTNEEMLFVHNLLITNHVLQDGVYIGMNSFGFVLTVTINPSTGLTDAADEGVWRWVHDNSRAIFTAWKAGGGNEYSQPDGATIENCALVKLNGLKSSPSWHDVPCAMDEYSTYICKHASVVSDQLYITGTWHWIKDLTW